MLERTAKALQYSSAMTGFGQFLDCLIAIRKISSRNSAGETKPISRSFKRFWACFFDEERSPAHPCKSVSQINHSGVRKERRKQRRTFKDLGRKLLEFGVELQNGVVHLCRP